METNSRSEAKLFLIHKRHLASKLCQAWLRIRRKLDFWSRSKRGITVIPLQFSYLKDYQSLLSSYIQKIVCLPWKKLWCPEEQRSSFGIFPFCARLQQSLSSSASFWMMAANLASQVRRRGGERHYHCGFLSSTEESWIWNKCWPSFLCIGLLRRRSSLLTFDTTF